MPVEKDPPVTDRKTPVTEVPADPSQIQRNPDHPPVPPGALLLELVPVPVTDIDRALAFYRDQVGFQVDVDVTPTAGTRIVQLTPPGSACSLVLAEGVPTLDAPVGSLRGLHLVVADIEAARATLVERGVAVGEVEDVGGGVLYAYFADPDGNTWCLQHMPWR
jgi:predicted enzyme related to lactoylglutathione lyase